MRKLLLIVLFLVTGCGATGPIYQTPNAPPSGYASLIIFRLPTLAAGAWPQYFWLDKTMVAKLRVEGYTQIYVKEGEHEARAGEDPNYRGLVVPLSVKAGENYYLQYGTSVSSVFMAGTTPITENSGMFSLVSHESATKELLEYHFEQPLAERVD
jgi:hypothetical protein